MLYIDWSVIHLCHLSLEVHFQSTEENDQGIEGRTGYLLFTWKWPSKWSWRW